MVLIMALQANALSIASHTTFVPKPSDIDTFPSGLYYCPMMPSGQSPGDCHSLWTCPHHPHSSNHVFEASKFKSFIDKGKKVYTHGVFSGEYEADWKLRHRNNPTDTELIRILFDVIEAKVSGGDRDVNFIGASASGVSTSSWSSLLLKD